MICLSITTSELIFGDITQSIKQYFNNLNGNLDSDKSENDTIYINIIWKYAVCINWLYFKVYHGYYLVGMRFIYGKFTQCFVILYDAINIEKDMVVQTFQHDAGVVSRDFFNTFDWRTTIYHKIPNGFYTAMLTLRIEKYYN